MNPRNPEPLDPITKQPRRIPWGRWLLYAAGGLLVLSAVTWLALRSYMTISVAPDTTVLTAPLLADGYPDYIGYLDAANAAGVKPEENAWIAILRCCGPDDIDKAVRAEHYRKLGIEPLPEGVLYFQSFYGDEGLKLVPESVLIASSVAAQLPWHTRFVRLAALNAYREANGANLPDPLMEPEPEPAGPSYESLVEHVGQTAQLAAQAAWDFAEDPYSARVNYAFEADDLEYSYFDNDEEANIQDLRAEALAKIKPAFDTPEEEAAWRRELFKSTRFKLIYEREEVMMSGQPWTRAECPLGAHWVETFSPYLDQLQKELRQRKKMYVPCIQKPGDTTVIGALLPPIQLQRKLALSYAYRANLYLGEKNTAAALDDLISIIEIGALLPQHPMLLEELVAVAVEGIGYDHLARLIQSSALTDEQLAELDIRLAKIVHQFDMADCLDHSERLSSIGQAIASLARGDESFVGTGVFGTNKSKTDPPWEQKIVHWDSVLRAINIRYDACRDAVKTGQFAKVEQIDQYYKAEPVNREELEAYYENPPWYLLPSKKTEVMKLMYSETFSPSLVAGYSASIKGSLRRDLFRVMLALERFRRENKDYPAALTELVPAYFPAVPTDPFDGKPMKYLRTPTGGYRAYSVWQNGIDDGGIPNMTSDGTYDDYPSNDWVVGSPDEKPRGLSLEW